MNITINGDVYITNYGQKLSELTEGAEFDDFDCDDDCECCGCECDYENNMFLDPLEILVEEYAEILAGEEICFDCAKAILENFAYDLISNE